MEWPTGNDYYEAIQDPRVAFADAELRGGTVECNQLGLPKPRTGAFATVYRVTTGSKAWAVRCFNREVQDQQRRYSVISDYLRRNPLPYMVEFSFINEGMKVRGAPYPMLKMEWVSGDPLHVYVEKHINDAQRLRDLANNWLAMSLALQKAGIAHGDLQHGNVLVVGSSLKLVDYDGMYVPSLNGSKSDETGQPNYQLPTRTALDYGPYLDYFSEWVVFVSLLALSIDASLWRKFGGGDECLLFRRRDFEDPDQSLLFGALEHHRNSQLAALVSMFKTFLLLSPAAVPPLDAVAMPQVGQTVSVTSTGSGADWIVDHLPKGGGTEHKRAEAQQSFAQPSWILDFTAPLAPPIEFTDDPLRLRAICWATILVSFAGALIMWSALSFAVAAIGIAIIGVLLARAYVARPELRASAASRAAVRQVAEESRLCSEEMQRFEVVRQRLRADQAAEKKEIQHRRALLSSQQQKSENQIRDQHATVIGPLQRQIQGANANETAELAGLQKDLGSKVSDLQNRIVATAKAATDEMTSRLKAIQDAYVQTVLSKAWIATSQITGIGAGYKARLQTHGFRTAADVSYYAVQRVQGIGETRAKALAGWRLNLENVAKQRMPKQLSPTEALQINHKYASAKQALTDEFQRNQQRLLSSQQSIRQKYTAIKTSLEAAISTDQANLQRELGAIVADFRSRQAKLSDEDAQATTKNDAAVVQAGEQMDVCARKMAAVQWKKGKLDREPQRYAHLTFGYFLKRAMVGK